MPVSAAISGGISAIGSIGSGLLGYFGSQNAAKQQQQSQQQAMNLQQSMFGTAQNALTPFINAGQDALPTLKALLTPGANMSNVLSQIPGFQFAQDWGQKAVKNLGSTMGLGGNVLKAGADYATGAASSTYSSIVQALQNLANTGASGGNALAGSAGQFGSMIGNTIGNIGNAGAAGTLGGTNALSGGLTGATNAGSNAFILNSLLSKAGGPTGPGYGNNPGDYNPNVSGGIYTG